MPIMLGAKSNVPNIMGYYPAGQPVFLYLPIKRLYVPWAHKIGKYHTTICYERANSTGKSGREAVTTVAKRYGVSDVALRKICKQLACPCRRWATDRVAWDGAPTRRFRYSGPAVVRQRYVSDMPVSPI
jgi:hypothetical protein